MMKSIFIFLFTIWTTSLVSQDLNKFGHIEDVDFIKEYSIQGEGNQQFITYRGIAYPGNTFIKLTKGFATIENSCGNTPSTIRIYTKNGDHKSIQKYDQTINPSTDSSLRYLYFQSGQKTIIIDTESLQEAAYLTTHNIAVNREGNPIYFDAPNNKIITSNAQFEIDFTPLSIELDEVNNIFVFGRHQYAIINDGSQSIYAYKTGTFFESKTIKGKVSWVEKETKNKTFNFKLNQKIDGEKVTLKKHAMDMKVHSKNISHQRSDGVQILCPMFPDSMDYPFRIGNSYAEHQKYSGQPYLHPGIDILGEPFQEIYSPVSGVIKAILTTSGLSYWRIALGLENKPDEQDGYLFAHLDPMTIPFAVGDSVSAGDYLGSIVEWSVSDFHHLHFARLRHQGEIWDGNWLTKDNILSDIINFKDESVPVFEPLWNGQTIAFRSEDGTEILSPDGLFGSFDIICHAHDLSNDDWRLDVDSLGFEIIDLTTDEIVYEQEAFSYDFILDRYEDNVTNSAILNTIYSTENEWQTLGNYNKREFYQQVSRSNGDGVIDENDANVFFDSNIIPDGSYIVRIHAYDAAQNHNFTEVEVIIDNSPTGLLDLSTNPIHIYPNPSSGRFNLTTNGNSISKVKIFNSQGELIKLIDGVEATNTIQLEKSGFYFLHFFGSNNRLLKLEKLVVQK